MAIWQGDYWSAVFQLKRCNEAETPVDITGWEFRSQFREERDGDVVLIELTTGNTGIVTIDPQLGTFQMQMQAEQTALLEVDQTIDFDVQHSNVVPGPVVLFWGKVPVKLPVTRLPYSVGPAPPAFPTGAVSMRQWRSALQAQGKLQLILDALPADQTAAAYIQWDAGDRVLPPPTADDVWTFTQLITGNSNAAMYTLHTLALTKAV